MRRRWIAMVLGAGACNAVFGLDPVDRAPIDAPDDASEGPPDASADADPCVTDDFDGTALDPHWSVLAGAAPTSSDVSGSRLLIADAPFAATPSIPSVSWIYELDVDRGNQLGWSQPIGQGDFTLDADLAWSSTGGELTLGGVGVSDSAGQLVAYVGMQDGSSMAVGHAVAHLLVTGAPDLAFTAANAEPGSARFRIARTTGAAVLSIDDVPVLTGDLPASIAYVTIIYVRYRINGTPSPYGSFEVRQIRRCPA